MGVFSFLNPDSKLMSVKIDFASEHDAFVQYASRSSDDVNEKIYLLELFYLYYGKQLFNLSGTPPSNSGLDQGELPLYLIARMEAAISALGTNGDESPVKVLSSDETLLVEPSRKILKTYKGELWQKKNGMLYPQTPSSANAHGGEAHYAPLSVLMLLQFIVNNVNESLLGVLCLTVKGLDQIYMESKSYQSPAGILQTTSIAKQNGLQMFKEMTQ